MLWTSSDLKDQKLNEWWYEPLEVLKDQFSGNEWNEMMNAFDKQKLKLQKTVTLSKWMNFALQAKVLWGLQRVKLNNNSK